MDDEFFDHVGFLRDVTGYITRHMSHMNRGQIAAEIANATGLSRSTIQNSLAGNTSGLKAVSALAAFCDLDMNRYVKGL